MELADSGASHGGYTAAFWTALAQSANAMLLIGLDRVIAPPTGERAALRAVRRVARRHVVASGARRPGRGRRRCGASATLAGSGTREAVLLFG